MTQDEVIGFDYGPANSHVRLMLRPVRHAISNFTDIMTGSLDYSAEHSYCLVMGVVEAGSWGVCGGLAAGLVALGAAITAAGFKWPWKGNEDGPWPRICVYMIGVIVGTVVAAAAHSQMTGALPALLMGASAPSVVRGAVSRIEVSESKPDTDVELIPGGDHGDSL